MLPKPDARHRGHPSPGGTPPLLPAAVRSAPENFWGYIPFRWSPQSSHLGKAISKRRAQRCDPQESEPRLLRQEYPHSAHAQRFTSFAPASMPAASRSAFGSR